MMDQTPKKRPDDADPEATLIERAVDAFDLSNFSPPPVPESLAPRAPRLSRPVQAPPRGPAPTTPPVGPERSAPAFATVDDPAPDATNEREQVAAVAETAVESVNFTGKPSPVDRNRLRTIGLIDPEGAVTGVLEEFRIVKRQLLAQAAELRRQGGGGAAQRVLICSPHPGEGKTYCATNLALSIAAEKESEVLLVDADFAKPSVLSLLGLPGGPGLMDALTDPSIDVAQCVVPTDIAGLSVLPAGSTTNTDSEYLNSSRTRPVLDRLTQGTPHRIVIFDSPPALAASPAAELARHVGQALIVVRADQTSLGALEDAISLLSGCPNIQLLLNAAHFSPSGRRFGSYYGYGE